MIKPNYLAILNKDKNLFKESSSNNMVGKLFKEAEDEELDLGEEGATGDGGTSDNQGLDFGDSGDGMFDGTETDGTEEHTDPVTVSDLAYDEENLKATSKSVRIEYLRDVMREKEEQLEALVERTSKLPANVKSVLQRQITSLNILYENVYLYNTNLSKYPANELFRKKVIIDDTLASIVKEIYLILDLDDDTDTIGLGLLL